MTLNPIRVTMNQACDLLAISRDKLLQLRKHDPSFPQSYKSGTSRQCAVYFDYQSLVNWHNAQLETATDLMEA